MKKGSRQERPSEFMLPVLLHVIDLSMVRLMYMYVLPGSWGTFGGNIIGLNDDLHVRAVYSIGSSILYAQLKPYLRI